MGRETIEQVNRKRITIDSNITHISPITDASNPKTCSIYCANISSFSLVSQQTLTQKMKQHSILACVEHHKPTPTIEQFFQAKGWRVECTPPEPVQPHAISNSHSEYSKTSGHGHGGEFVASSKYIQCNNIQHDILHPIAEKTQAPRRFAATILRLRHVSVVLVAIYLWDTEGLSERNQNLLYQLYLLTLLFNMPFIVYGDFNMSPNLLAESEWLNKLRMRIFVPNVKSTLARGENSLIDFVLISFSFAQCLVSLEIDYQVSWWPHFGLVLCILANPRSVQGNVLCIPKKLPFVNFSEHWDNLNEEQQNEAICVATTQAKHKLSKQKTRTGVAILGRPNAALKDDPKFQGKLQADSISEGEKLAMICLMAELLICTIAGILPQDRHAYIGRSQYPKFKIKPIVRTAPPIICSSCIHIDFWTKMKGMLFAIKHAVQEKQVELATTFASDSHEVSDHLSTLSEEVATCVCDQFMFSTPEHLVTHIDEHVELACSALRETSRMFFNECMAERKKYFQQQLFKGGGKLFKHISKEDKAHVSVSSEAQNLSPMQFLDKQSDKWKVPWSLAPHEQHILTAILQQTREDTLSDNPPRPFNVELLDEGLAGYKKDALGGDLRGASELRNLPRKIRNMIANQVNDSFQLIAWPHQQLVSLHPCLGKSNGGVRTICLTPMIYRMVLRAIGGIKQWESTYTQDYDKAKTGSSALLVAVARGLRAEIGQLLDRVPAAIFNDFHQFFDHIDIGILIVEAIHLQVPMHVILLVLQQHLSPRIIQAEGYSAQPITIWRSIIQGCVTSVGLTRIYILRDMVALVRKHASANVSVFVDDTTSDAAEATLEHTQQIVVPFTLDFAQTMVKKNKLVLSPKGCVVSNTTKRAKLIAKELKQSGLEYNAAGETRDLGVTYAGGASRPSSLIGKRIGKVRNRIAKIKNIAKVSRLARKLYTGSAFSAATWGNEVAGLSPNQVVVLERQALACTGITAAGRCRRTSLVVAYGLLSTPHARIIIQTIKTWFEILQLWNLSEVSSASDISQAWAIARRKIHASSKPVKCVQGILSNVIFILFQANWVPYAPNLWIDPNGTHWKLDPSVSSFAVSAQITKDTHASQLSEAAQHYDGKGIQEGINWDITLRHIRGLRQDKHKKHDNYNAICTLETIMCAGCWPANRVSSVNPLVANVCPRCNMAVEDSLHSFWTCPANAEIDDHRVSSTQCLIHSAVQHSPEYPCLWLRGILPLPLSHPHPIPEPPTDAMAIILGDNVCWESGIYYGDGSGGGFSSFPAIRRCGVGLVKIHQDGSKHFEVSMNLPGSVQTVPRAEYFALYYLLTMVVAGSTVEFVTDHKPLYKLFLAGKVAARKCANHDLMIPILQMVSVKDIDLTVRWMPSHLSESDPLPTDVSIIDVRANNWADIQAKIGAQRICVDLNTSSPIIFYTSLVKRIQNRLIAIITNLPHRINTHTKRIAAPKENIEATMQRSTHVCFVQSDRMQCARCLSSIPINNHNKCLRFLASDCATIGSDTDRPVPLSSDLVQIGKLDIHVSHKLLVFKGIVFCDKCGAISQRKKLGNLASVCCPPTTYGKNNLERLRKGNLPINVLTWPTQSIFRDSLESLYATLLSVASSEEERVAAATFNNQFRDIHRSIHHTDIDSDYYPPSMSACDPQCMSDGDPIGSEIGSGGEHSNPCGYSDSD